MIIFNNTSIEHLTKIILRYQSEKQKYSNFYLNEYDGIEYFECSSTLMLRKKYGTYNRVYFMSSDKDKLSELLKMLTKKDIINVPFKGSINSGIDIILEKSGYVLAGQYERLFSLNNKMRGKFVEKFANNFDLDDISHILNDNFNPYLDHIPSNKILKSMIEQENVLVNRDVDTNKVTGIFIFTPMKNQYYFNCWLDIGGNGLFLLLNMLNYLKEKQIERSYLWVNSNNIEVKNIYYKLGYSNSGLVDYTYVKK